MPESLEGVKATRQPPTYLPHRLLAYQAPAVRARRAAAPYGPMAIAQVTGAVTRMRNASCLFSGPMLEMSGRSGK